MSGCVTNQPKVKKSAATQPIQPQKQIEPRQPEIETKKSYNEDGTSKAIQYLKNGVEIEKFTFDYYPSGKIKIKLRTVNDITNGRSEAYFEDGSLSQYRNYVNDLQYGEFEDFYDNGKVSKSGTYKNDKLNGAVKSYNKAGNILSEIVYTAGVEGISIYYEYKDDNLEWERNYNNKTLVQSKKYYPNGSLEFKAGVKNGEINGTLEEYYINGNIKKKTTYQNGKKTGLEKGYFKNGELSWELNQIDGKTVGVYKLKFPNYFRCDV